MKYIKIMGLAITAALAVMAFAGAGTASASATVCQSNVAPCPTPLGSGTKISAQLKAGTHATLTTSLTNVTCKKSTVAGSLTNSTGHGSISSLTFTDCETTSGTACTVKAVNLPYTATAIANGGGGGTLTITPSAGKGNPGATVECGSLINCTFSSPHFALGVAGGNPAYITAKEVALERSGGFCPSTSVWHAEYEVTAPKPLYLVNHK